MWDAEMPRKTLVKQVPQDIVVEGHEVIVLEDVHGKVRARGGGAKVVVLGDVHRDAEVAAEGGGATVVIHGRVL